MYNIEVYTKDDNKLFIRFDIVNNNSKLFTKEEILIILKSILGAYGYGVVNISNNISLHNMINTGFNNGDTILKEYYNANNKDLFNIINEIFIIKINDIELPNTVEEMFK